MRTIKQFISQENKVYFFMKDKDTCLRFYREAESEGITFGGTKPTEKETTDLIALLPSGEICYVGWAGRMCYHNSQFGVIRIDYEKYLSGNMEYFIDNQYANGKTIGFDEYQSQLVEAEARAFANQIKEKVGY